MRSRAVGGTVGGAVGGGVGVQTRYVQIRTLVFAVRIQSIHKH